jgi:hypothetical protein
LGIWALTPQHRLLVGGSFLILYCTCSFEILVCRSSHCKFFMILSLGLRRFRMSEQRIVEHKKVCCFMFLLTVGLITHSLLYKVFFNKCFAEYFSYVNSFVKSNCVSYSKLVWRCSTILSVDVSVAFNL